uniref:CBS domain-containing protein CBSX3-like n=1 Tax=Rhizophora mucronata TaxID=61149 RepID=A0A2P2LH29_RHIMU
MSISACTILSLFQRKKKQLVPVYLSKNQKLKIIYAPCQAHIMSLGCHHEGRTHVSSNFMKFKSQKVVESKSFSTSQEPLQKHFFFPEIHQYENL